MANILCCDWLTDQTTVCCFAVIGRPRHPTILCYAAKKDPVGPPCLLADIGDYIFLSCRDWPVQYPEEYLYTSTVPAVPLMLLGVPQRQSHHRSGLATLPSVGAIP